MCNSTKQRLGVVVVLILLEINGIIGAKLTRMTQKIDFGPETKPDSVLIYDKNNFANPGLVYGVCNINSTSSDVFTCKMFMESNKAVGTPQHVRSCNVTVKRVRRGHTVYRSVVALDDDTAVMVPHEYNATSLTFIHFPDCRTRIVDLKYDLSSAKVLAPLDNAFDLIRIEGDSKCFSECRLIMDFGGSIILNVHKWLRNFHNEYAAMQSPTKGRLLVSTPSVFLDPALQVSVVNYDGEVEILKSYPTDYDPTSGYRISASTTHQLLTACAAVNLTITCGQFDFNGGVTSEINLSIVQFTHLHSIKVFNLPEGGYVLLYAGCSRNSSEIVEYDCQYSQNNFFATKIDPSGKLIGTLEIVDFKGNNTLERLHFFVDQENKLCLSQSYLADGFMENGLLNLDVVCFGDGELSF